MHVEMRGERKFQLVWKEGSTVINTIDVERKEVPIGAEGDYTYPGLAEAIEKQWKQNGNHRAATDKKFDTAVLHTDNSTPFSDVIAVIDAIYRPQRDYSLGGVSEKVPSFNVTFAVN